MTKQEEIRMRFCLENEYNKKNVDGLILKTVDLGPDIKEIYFLTSNRQSLSIILEKLDKIRIVNGINVNRMYCFCFYNIFYNLSVYLDKSEMKIVAHNYLEKFLSSPINTFYFMKTILFLLKYDDSYTDIFYNNLIDFNNHFGPDLILIKMINENVDIEVIYNFIAIVIKSNNSYDVIKSTIKFLIICDGITSEDIKNFIKEQNGLYDLIRTYDNEIKSFLNRMIMSQDETSSVKAKELYTYLFGDLPKKNNQTSLVLRKETNLF